MTDRFTAKSGAIRGLMARNISAQGLADLARDDNPNDDERKAAKMMLLIGGFIAEKEEATA